MDRKAQESFDEAVSATVGFGVIVLALAVGWAIGVIMAHL